MIFGPDLKIQICEFIYKDFKFYKFLQHKMHALLPWTNIHHPATP